MNFLKKISAMMLIVALVACVMCGCGNDAQNPSEPENTAMSAGDVLYTVTVMDQNDNAVSNVVLQFADVNGDTQLAVTGENGIVAVDSEVSLASVTLTSIPDGYTSTVTVVDFNGESAITIVLQAEEEASTDVTYTVTVKDQNGSPVPGVTVQLCDDEACKLPVVTDADGVAVCTYPESNYHVSLTELPGGYSSKETTFYFEEGSTEITIVINAD